MTPEKQGTQSFARRLLSWHKVAGRHDLPWQHDPTPYRVWISEIMLQQTQVDTVREYFQRWMQRFDSIEAVAEAPLDEVLHQWSGLGYYARARNIHRAALVLHECHGGEFPDDFDAVLALPGIGPSTAGAILSLARNERHAILDGNVKRVLSRYHGVEGWPGQAAVAKKLWALAEQHTPNTDNAAYTQAIMDLGATVCTRTRPRCNDCPIAGQCVAKAAGRQRDFPGTRPKKKRPVRTTVMALLEDPRGRVLLEHRQSAGLWGGLWSLPQHDSLANLEEWVAAVGTSPADLEPWPLLRHGFTHFQLEITPVRVRLADRPAAVGETTTTRWVDPTAMPALGIAAPVARLLEQLAIATEAPA